MPSRARFLAWTRAALAAAARSPLGGRASTRSARAQGRPRWLLSIRIVGAARSRTLNARYRGKPKPTNVLSFAGAGRLPDGQLDLGELVICAPVLAREAAAAGQRPEAHWAHITVHGVLHLLGFDHERAADARRMMRREIQVLGLLGISNPYS